MGCSTQGARDKSHCDKLVQMEDSRNTTGKTNILNEQFTSVFTKEEKNNILEKGLSPLTPIRNITISDSGVRTPKREESKWTRQDAHHIVKTNSQHHNTSNIIYISTIIGPGRNTNRLEKCEHSANL